VLGQCGVVFVVWTDGWKSRWPEIPSDSDVYSCSWQNHEEGDIDGYQSAEFETLDEALRWAWHRSTRVIVRPQWDTGTEYLATEEPPEHWRAIG
jgi:hypothetical protein